MTFTHAGGRARYRHELLVYDSDEELLAFVVPYVHAATEARQPAFVELPARETALVRAALGPDDLVAFVPTRVDQSPTSRIRTLRSLVDELDGSPVAEARFASTVPHPGLDAVWHPWSRYEAAINELFADLPIWGVCLYDRRITPDSVLADVERTHPHVRTSDGAQIANPRYEEPRSFLESMPPAPPDPLEANPPAVALDDPSPASARRAVEEGAEQAGLTAREADDMKIAVSEAITNAITYGRPPTTMQLWTAPGRVVVTVTDRGDGPQDLYAGLVPTAFADRSGGYGLWITHQLSTATHSRTDDGFTIRLIGGRPLP